MMMKTQENVNVSIQDMLRMEYEKRVELENKLLLAKKEIEKLRCSVLEERIERCDSALYGGKTDNILIRIINKIRKIQKRLYQKKMSRELLKHGMSFWEPVFDVDFYKETYPELVDKVGDSAEALLRHFVMYGIEECRAGNKEFDVEAYLAYNLDIRRICQNSYMPAYFHYIQYGRAEKRVCAYKEI